MTRISTVVWVEKYRPQTLDDIYGNDKEVRRLKEWVDDPSCPNVLLWGPQGTGKTTAVQAFAREKYGEDWNNHVLEMNASDERGIKDVRTKVKKFASEGGVLGDADWNIIMLDEVDHMTRDAQPALRKIMEDYTDRCRFFLVCNWPNKLIDPIQSRCAPLKMSPLDDDAMLDILTHVSETEGIEYDTDQLQTIVNEADGDGRKAIHTLQSAVVDGKVEDWSLESMISIADQSTVDEIVETAVSGDVNGARDKMSDLLETGVDSQRLCDNFVTAVERSELPADTKALMVDKIADCEWRILHGTSPEIQFGSLLWELRIGRFTSLQPYRDEEDGAYEETVI